MSSHNRLKRAGFTLMELLIAITIVAILAAVAIPSYLHYVKKSQFSEIVTAGDSLKNAVAQCIQRTEALTACDGGAEGIPDNVTTGPTGGLIGTITVSNGVITVAPQAKDGFATSDTYILTPTLDSGSDVVTWAVTGGGNACDFVSGNCTASS